MTEPKRIGASWYGPDSVGGDYSIVYPDDDQIPYVSVSHLLSEEVVEAVARGLCRAEGVDPDSVIVAPDGYQPSKPHLEWHRRVDSARAALEAAVKEG